MIKCLETFGRVTLNASLKELNTYRIGGITKYLVVPNSAQSTLELIKYLREENVEYKVFGNGSNMIVGSKLFDGVVIKLSSLNQIEVDSHLKTVEVGAGVMLPQLAYKVLEYGLVGFEWASGIPGTVGGSIVGNAGAYNTEIFDMVINVTILDEIGEIVKLNVNDIAHSYRHSEFQERDIVVLSVLFQLEDGDIEEAKELINFRKFKRIESQPLEYPSAGSVFRNPSEEELEEAYENYDLKGPFAGHLIEECGLKGKIINGAQISEKHANFIVNYNNATSEDVKELIDLASLEVEKKFNCKLNTEQEFFNWD